MSLAALDRTPESRLWMVLVAFFAWIPLSLALSGVAELLVPGAGGVLGIATSMVGILLGFAFLVALVWDAKHIRQRDDVDWEPSQMLYWGMAAATFMTFFLASPLVAGYHLYRRKQEMGLPLRRF